MVRQRLTLARVRVLVQLLIGLAGIFLALYLGTTSRTKDIPPTTTGLIVTMLLIGVGSVASRPKEANSDDTPVKRLARKVGEQLDREDRDRAVPDEAGPDVDAHRSRAGRVAGLGFAVGSAG